LEQKAKKSFFGISDAVDNWLIQLVNTFPLGEEMNMWHHTRSMVEIFTDKRIVMSTLNHSIEISDWTK
jgi:hypothetical protein